MHREEVRHELRTPLTVVKGVLRLLQHPAGTQLPPDIRTELIEKANAQVRRLESAMEVVEMEFTDPSETDVIVIYEESTATVP